MSNYTDGELFERLLEDEGLSHEEWLEEFALDSVVPAACRTCGEVTSDMEPDQDCGHCEHCGNKTAVAGTMLLGIV